MTTRATPQQLKNGSCKESGLQPSVTPQVRIYYTLTLGLQSHSLSYIWEVVLHCPAVSPYVTSRPAVKYLVLVDAWAPPSRLKGESIHPRAPPSVPVH